ADGYVLHELSFELQVGVHVREFNSHRRSQPIAFAFCPLQHHARAAAAWTTCAIGSADATGTSRTTRTALSPKPGGPAWPALASRTAWATHTPGWAQRRVEPSPNLGGIEFAGLVRIPRGKPLFRQTIELLARESAVMILVSLIQESWRDKHPGAE